MSGCSRSSCMCLSAGPAAEEYRDDPALRTDGDFLSHNFCVWGGNYFAIRMRVPLPVRGAAPAAFLFAAWVGLDKLDFEAFSARCLNG